MATRSAERGARIRRTMIDVSLRRQRPGNGSLSLQPRKTYHLQWPDLSAALHGTAWAVVGAVATRRYMPERETPALDIVVLEPDEHEAKSKLEAAGYARQGHGESHWRSPEGTAVHVIALADPWLEPALKEAATNLGTDGLPFLPLPYLVLMKMHAIHMQDLADVERMLAASSPSTRDEVRATIAQFEPEFLTDFDDIIILAKRTACED